jgi:hypothetical protein
MFDKLGYSYFCHQNQYNTSYSELKLVAHFFFQISINVLIEKNNPTSVQGFVQMVRVSG